MVAGYQFDYDPYPIVCVAIGGLISFFIQLFGCIQFSFRRTFPLDRINFCAIPISIDILMFDSSQKNIGFITYCSEKDLDTDYSGAVIRQKESLPLFQFPLRLLNIVV